MNGVQTRLKCKPNVKQCKRLVFPARSALFNHNILNTKAISHFQANHILIRFVFPPLNGKLYRITPAVAYTSADLNWNNKASRSSVEMADENSRPALGGETLNLKDYDVVFLGYPIWWDLCPRPVNAFFEKYDFSGKTVIPFATSGGSSITGSVKQLKALYPQIGWQAGRLCNGSAKQAGDWAKRVISVE